LIIAKCHKQSLKKIKIKSIHKSNHSLTNVKMCGEELQHQFVALKNVHVSMEMNV
jgi:hypothetical protein